MKIFTSMVFCFAFFVSSLVMAGQVRLDATVDRNVITMDDTVTLTLVLSSDTNINEEDEPRLPTLDGFELLQKWTQSSTSSVFENGKFTFMRKILYYYTLQPQKTGNLTIGAAEMRVNGDTLQSKPITIKVMPAGAGGGNQGQAQRGQQRGRGQQAQPDDDQSGMPQAPGFDDDDEDLFSQLLRRRGLGVPGGGVGGGRGGSQGGAQNRQNPNINNKEAFFITVETNKQKAYVGEEIVATWYLYTRGALQNFDALKYPDLKGFWKEDLELPQRLNFQQEIVNGIPYQKAVLVSYALFPIGAGKKVLDPYKAKATVISLDSAMSMFGLGHPFTYVKTSKDVPIEVIPLPTEGRPASFSGAVGHFSITGQLSATQAKVNQPVSLKIRFSGEGNVKAIELPPMNLPNTIELYDTKKDSQFNKNGEGYKEFELLLIPRAQGEVSIPPIEVSYFDPKSAKYVTSHTPQFTLKVLPGDGSSAPAPNSPLSQNEPAQQPQTAKDVRYLKTSAGFSFSPATQAVGWSLLYLLVFGWFGFQIWKVNGGGEADTTALLKKRVKAKLREAQLKMKKGDWRGVGVESSNAVMSTLGEVSGVGGVSLTAEEMLGRLPNGTQALQARVQKFLSRCEIVSFAPKELAEQMRTQGRGDQDMKEMIAEAEKIISELFQAAKREKSGSQAASSVTNQ